MIGRAPRDYRIVQLIAEGGMGSVYQAVGPQGRLALKLMDPKLASQPDFRERFLREAKTIASLRSDHIAQVLDYGEDPNVGPYLAMELLEGEDLNQRVSRAGPLNRLNAKRVLSDVAEGLRVAHESGVVHRDLKCANVFLTQPAGRAKLIDFGIAATLVDQTRRKNTAIIGTVGWMAPEQLDASGQVGREADIWAFGLLAFFTLTGRHFWVAEPLNHGALIKEVCFDTIPAASLRAREHGFTRALPPAFDPWLARCLQRQPQHRYPTITTAMERLSSLLRITLAHPTPTPPVVAPVGVVPQAPLRSLLDQQLQEAIDLLRERIPVALAAMRAVDGVAAGLVRPPSAPASSQRSSPPPLPVTRKRKKKKKKKSSSDPTVVAQVNLAAKPPAAPAPRQRARATGYVFIGLGALFVLLVLLSWIAAILDRGMLPPLQPLPAGPRWTLVTQAMRTPS